METITKETTEIKTEFMGTFHKALVTPDFTYFVNYEEGDMNGNTKMYRNSNGELVSDNYFGGEDCIRALLEDEHIFISKEAKENIHLMAEAEMEMITDSVGLNHDKSEDEFGVYINEDENIFVAVSIDQKKVFRYKLTKPIEDIRKENREDVLKYRYANLTEGLEVQFDDVFMHGEFVELIK
jgi:hypothetical protein